MYSRIFKDSEASRKAWLIRQRLHREAINTKSKTGLVELYDKHNDPNASVDQALLHFTKKEKAEVVLKVIKAQNEKTSLETFSKVDPATNHRTWGSGRAAIHAKIINEVLSDAAIKAATPAKGEQPTYIILGGRGGSGKSAFTDGKLKEFDASKFLVLDSDKIKEHLRPPYDGWNAFSVHDEAQHIFDAITLEAHARGLNIVHDSTLRSDGVGSTITQMKKDGYRVEGHYMFLPRQDAAVRAVQRYLGKDGKRGRLVPPAVVLANTENEKNFERLTKYFDKWSAYDNTGPKGSTPKLVKRGKE